MKCVICKAGETSPGTHTLTLTRGEAVVVIRDVPADVCSTCGEAYVAGPVAERALRQANAAFQAGASVQVSVFAA